MRYFVVLCLSLFLCSSFTNKNTGKIIVKIYGCSSNKGKVVISLVNNEENYVSDGSPYKYGYATVDSNNCSYFTFENVPFGEYGVQLFYDENNNKKLDTSFGIPTEQYGFSNNARGTFSKPKFSKISFNVNQAVVEQKIYVK